MTDKKKEKPDKPTDEEYKLTTSDWIVYLESKSTRNVSVYLGILSVFVILFISLSNTIENVYLLISLVVVIYIIFLLIDRMMKKKIEPLQNLSQDIILGKITDTKEIRKRYEDYLEKHHKKNRIL